MSKTSASAVDLPLPKDWQDSVRDAFVAAVGLAHSAITFARSWAVNSRVSRVRLAAECDRLQAELALSHRELDLLRARFARVPARNRPHFLPPERLAVLQLKAARAWNASELARRLLLTHGTVSAWLRRLDEDGERVLVRVPVPVNRFPDFVAKIVQDLGGLLPTMGRRRIAELLARAGLHLSASTVKRLRDAPPKPPQPTPADAGESVSVDAAECPETTPETTPKKPQPVTARAPHHTWHCDLTVVPISSGLWVPWFPFALPTFWPFTWHAAVVLDHFSRLVVGFEVFTKEPSASEVTRMLDAAIATIGKAPKYIITDKGTQFRTDYVDWCRAQGIQPRFGALGSKGAIALIERFMLSLKSEALRRILVPMGFEAMRDELAAYFNWYNRSRPHQALRGRTPLEVAEALAPARDGPRFEPRPAFKVDAGDLHAERGAVLECVVDFDQGRRHLPLVTLRKAA